MRTKLSKKEDARKEQEFRTKKPEIDSDDEIQELKNPAGDEEKRVGGPKITGAM